MTRNKYVLLPIWICSEFLLFGVDTSTIFIATPSNQTIALGGTAKFQCSLPRIILSSDLEVAWFRGNTLISSGREIKAQQVESERYSVTGTNGEFTLQIIEVKTYDEAKFICKVRDKLSGFVNVTAPAYLKVNHPPSDGYPACFPPMKNFGIGEELDFSCRSDEGSPAVELMWDCEGENVTDAFLDDDFLRLGYYRLNFQKVLTLEDNGKTFRCRSFHPLFSQPRECLVGPLTVHFPPVDVHISSGSAKILSGDDVTLECLARANPDRLSYDWSINPHYDGKTRKFGSGYIISRVNARLNGSLIQCTVSNLIGTGSANFTLAVFPKEIPSTRKPNPKQTNATPSKNKDSLLSDTTTVAFILAIVILCLIILVIMILFISQRSRTEQVVVVDYDDEIGRRSLSGGSVITGSHLRIVTPMGDRRRFHRERTNDTHSIDSAIIVSPGTPIDSPEYPSDPAKLAELQPNYKMNLDSRSDSNVSSNTAKSITYYERSLPGSLCNLSNSHTQSLPTDAPVKQSIESNSYPSSPFSAQITLDASPSHHADKNFYQNSPARRPMPAIPTTEVPQENKLRRTSSEHKYEDLTPTSERKKYEMNFETGEENFPSDSRPRKTPENSGLKNPQEVMEMSLL